MHTEALGILVVLELAFPPKNIRISLPPVLFVLGAIVAVPFTLRVVCVNADVTCDKAWLLLFPRSMLETQRVLALTHYCLHF